MHPHSDEKQLERRGHQQGYDGDDDADDAQNRLLPGGRDDPQQNPQGGDSCPPSRFAPFSDMQISPFLILLSEFCGKQYVPPASAIPLIYRPAIHISNAFDRFPV